MTLQDMAAVWNSDEWAEQYDHDGEYSADGRMRGGYVVERIARRNARKSATLAECGHCGETVDAANGGAEHVAACEPEHRPYRYGRA